MKKVFILFFGISVAPICLAQDSLNVTNKDTASINQAEPAKQTVDVDKQVSKYPYKTSFKRDAPVIATGIGLSGLGVTLIHNKPNLTDAELATKTKDKVPSFDRGNVGYYDTKLDEDSYVPFHASFAMPLVMLLLDNDQRRNASNILVMYLESLSITSALFTMAAGSVDRPRPLVYAPSNAPNEVRKKANNQRSFFAGHTAASATGTFFAAKVFSDLNPNSKLRPLIWAVSASVPAVVGYMRYKSGYHFLSDNILGYILGAATGILIPEWHKTKASKSLSFFPQVDKDFKGISFIYHIK